MSALSEIVKIFGIGSRNDRLLKRYRKTVGLINALESEFEKISDEQIAQKTQEFKALFNQGTSLDTLLPQAFALAREASKRTLGMRHFDVQLIGAMALHEGKIAEMGTGEGKTLMATAAVYLNALSGKSVHVVTVNDYLARRDGHWMKPLYEMLGLTVGVVVPRMRLDVKRQSYLSDVVYATNNELGFDYLRNKMAYSLDECLQKELSFAIVDEVDSILVDEARTPLIISGAADDSSELYIKMNLIAPKLVKQQIKDGPGDYTLDEKSRQVHLTEEGHQRVEGLLVEAQLLPSDKSLYDPANIGLLHHLNASLRAHAVYKRDVDYIVHNNEVVIVDEHTGRTMPGRRWSDGLHQAVEAKEQVEIQNENQTLASITFQNFFRLYDKLAGMTGTADTEAYEFQQIYGLEVVVIPTNKPCVRKDESDVVYISKDEKLESIINDIKETVAKKQPVLVGTASIENSEIISNLLNKHKIKHQVLNAKFHEQEAQIIAEAGRPSTVTIATNMAGRGTDIVLGGDLKAELKALEEPNPDLIEKIQRQWQQRHDDVVNAGGLRIIGTERHESRRIDNQLRGRAGRQGDPGSSRFYLSLEDNLMRIFGSDRMMGLMRKLGVQKNESITHPWVTRGIENAQRKVEGHNFDMRKQLLEYDNVANDQRRVIYDQRDALLVTDNISEEIQSVQKDVISKVIQEHINADKEDGWDVLGLANVLENEFGLKLPIQEWLTTDPQLPEETLTERILLQVDETYKNREPQIGQDNLRQVEKSVMFNALDMHWKEHLAQMEYLRQSIFLRGFAQKDPKQEYKREAFNLFTSMVDSIKRQVSGVLLRMEVQPSMSGMLPANHQDEFNEAPPVKSNVKPLKRPALVSDEEPSKISRNQPCPCQSGKKYKYCHGRLDEVPAT